MTEPDYLDDRARQEAAELLEFYKNQLTVIVNEAINDVMQRIVPRMDSAAWEATRASVMSAIAEESDAWTESERKSFRNVMYAHHQQEILADVHSDVIQEMAGKLEQLSETVKSRSAMVKRLRQLLKRYLEVSRSAVSHYRKSKEVTDGHIERLRIITQQTDEVLNATAIRYKY